MINKKAFSYMMSIMMMLGMILTSLLSFSQHVDARVMNVQKEGSLTIHKYLNPNIIPSENGGTGFQGNGTTENGINASGPNIGPIPESDENEGFNGLTTPLPGAEFSVYGRLTTEEVNSLMIGGSQSAPGYKPDDPKPLDTEKVKKFITEWDNDPNNKSRKKVGVTDDNGQITWDKIQINTVDLADNMYLVVETKTPTSGPNGEPIVQQPSMPVLVNIPSTNPEVDTKGKEVDNYNYNVNLYMKNYNQTEPGIEKEIDKPTHSVGEEVKYRLSIKPLAFDMNEYKELIVTDELAPELNFLQLGHTGGAAYLPLDQGNKIDTNKPEIAPEASVVFFQGSDENNKKVLEQNVDYKVTHPEVNKNGTIVWEFTEKGIKKLSGIEAGDGSRIELYFTAVTNEKAKVNQSIPNDAKLDFVNKWGYGTKPQPSLPGNPDPKQPTAPKPTEVVNTIWGERWFEKRDKQNNTIKLKGAEFLVRNRSIRPVTALNGKGEMVTYEPETTLYAIISNNTDKPNYPLTLDPNKGSDPVTPWLKNNKYVVGWTPDWKEAYNNNWTISSDDNGQFHVQGLEYTNEVHFRKMYIFKEMAIREENGTNVEVVADYKYVLADKRTATTSQNDINAEINGILKQHPGVKDGPLAGDGAWKFYKESEANPNIKDAKGNNSLLVFDGKNTEGISETELDKLKAPGAMVDYLGDEWNDYELIEVRAPEGYAPVEKNIEKEAAAAEGTTEPGDYEPGGKDVFEHPFGFKVPGETTDGLPNYGAPNYEGDLSNSNHNVVPVPNAKLPKIPLTGGMGTIIFLIVGLVLLVTAFVVKRFKVRKA